MNTKLMSIEDRTFLNDLGKRQMEANIGESNWAISTLEFQRAFALGHRNWSYMILNHATFQTANFYNHNFRHADLDGCKFLDCNLHAASFSNGTLREAQFSNCDLSDASWHKTDMRWTQFINCDLESVNLEQANLRLVKGIKTVSPVGSSGRVILAYVHDGKIRIQAGCRNEPPNKVRAAIRQDYAADPMNQEDYLDAVNLLERWGKRELKRLAQ